ncbi:YfgG family protein [Rouxiella chamberiensis]|uniref:YfgG family protein n=1 Tax=Rouxiella chamberiensis TaxID=1513468 RepID=A0ABY7HPT3_9GAMM|nr:YfgG family protein [Rouxiella chamberiensis]WAT01402.1 YfgG family protein [Rouxiella chamberiensis]
MRNKNNMKMTKIVLAISFIILIGRLIYAGIGSYSHHQNQKQVQTEQRIAPVSHKNQPDKTP